MTSLERTKDRETSCVSLERTKVHETRSVFPERSSDRDSRTGKAYDRYINQVFTLESYAHSMCESPYPMICDCDSEELRKIIDHLRQSPHSCIAAVIHHERAALCECILMWKFYDRDWQRYHNRAMKHYAVCKEIAANWPKNQKIQDIYRSTRYVAMRIGHLAIDNDV